MIGRAFEARTRPEFDARMRGQFNPDLGWKCSDLPHYAHILRVVVRLGEDKYNVGGVKGIKVCDLALKMCLYLLLLNIRPDFDYFGPEPEPILDPISTSVTDQLFHK